MTIESTVDRVTYQGNGSNTNFSYAFLIPEQEDLVLTVTTIADSSTEIIPSSAYSVTGIGESAGGIVTYPTSGPALSTAYNITIQRTLDLVQETQLVNQSGYYPNVVEDALDYLMMSIQQLNGQLDQCLAFPVGVEASAESIEDIMAGILNGAANAAAAAASAAEAEQAVADIEAILPLQTANIGDLQVTAAKLATDSVTAIKLADSAIAQSVTMLNGTLVASVAASALTVAVKTLAGSDPSATDPVFVIFRSVTQANGDYSVLALTAATNFVVSSGSTMGTTSNIPFSLWAVMFNDGGVARLGLINCTTVAPTVTMYPLNEWQPSSSTAEGGAGAADSAGVFYTGTAVASKAFAILGYLDFSDGQAVAGTWATAPDVIQLMRHGIKLPGEEVQKVRQYIATSAAPGSTAMPFDNSIPQIGEGVLLLTQAITPKSKCNRLKIRARVLVSNEGGAASFTGALFQDATANALVAAPVDMRTANVLDPLIIEWDMIANTTSSTSFTIRGGTNGGNTIRYNGVSGAASYGGVGYSVFEITEVKT